MFVFRPILLVVLLALSFPQSAFSAEDTNPEGLTVRQKFEIQQLIRSYVLENPELIVEAIQELQRRDRASAAERKGARLSSMSKDLTASPNDPVIGNPNGDVTMVEFFDYRCGFCKRAFKDVQKLLKADDNIRYVLKEFPILGDDSVYASRAAMAVWLHQPEKYKAFHTAMMLNKGALSNAKVMKLAKGAGVDSQALAEQMNDPKVDQTIAATAAQAQALEITGTPAFIVGSTIAPGAISLEVMQQLIEVERSKKTQKQ